MASMSVGRTSVAQENDLKKSGHSLDYRCTGSADHRQAGAGLGCVAEALRVASIRSRRLLDRLLRGSPHGL